MRAGSNVQTNPTTIAPSPSEQGLLHSSSSSKLRRLRTKNVKKRLWLLSSLQCQRNETPCKLDASEHNCARSEPLLSEVNGDFQAKRTDGQLDTLIGEREAPPPVAACSTTPAEGEYHGSRLPPEELHSDGEASSQLVGHSESSIQEDGCQDEDLEVIWLSFEEFRSRFYPCMDTRCLRRYHMVGQRDLDNRIWYKICDDAADHTAISSTDVAGHSPDAVASPDSDDTIAKDGAWGAEEIQVWARVTIKLACKSFAEAWNGQRTLKEYEDARLNIIEQRWLLASGMIPPSLHDSIRKLLIDERPDVSKLSHTK